MSNGAFLNYCMSNKKPIIFMRMVIKSNDNNYENNTE